jgi:hypothetical protein
MIPGLPQYIAIVFSLTTLITIWFLFKAGVRTKIAILLIICWLLLQAVLAWKGFYQVADTMPPRFMLTVVPPLLLIVVLFATKKGRIAVDGLNSEWLTWLHMVRVPVEFVLLWLFLEKQVPQIMTFEGRNFDIISGLTAPLVAWFGYRKGKMKRGLIIAWNILCIGLLVNIVVIAILSAPFAFQKFAFDQPNKAVFFFPFVWLPAFVVPAVLFAHLQSLRKLMK